MVRAYICPPPHTHTQCSMSCENYCRCFTRSLQLNLFLPKRILSLAATVLEVILVPVNILQWIARKTHGLVQTFRFPAGRNSPIITKVVEHNERHSAGRLPGSSRNYSLLCPVAGWCTCCLYTRLHTSVFTRLYLSDHLTPQCQYLKQYCLSVVKTGEFELDIELLISVADARPVLWDKADDVC